MERISTGTRLLDDFLNGGYERDVITTIYGPPGCGKTTLCILCLIGIARNNKKIIYMDTENGFSGERLNQLADDFKEVLAKTVFLRPRDFQEQKNCIEKLDSTVNDKIGIIIIDTIAMLYRLELKDEDVPNTNRELGRQISTLTNLASKYTIPVLVTNQVYADFENKNKVNIVGGDLLKYGSKCMIELKVNPNGTRKAILRKHRSIGNEREILYKITNNGIEVVKESKGFKLF